MEAREDVFEAAEVVCSVRMVVRCAMQELVFEVSLGWRRWGGRLY